MSGFIPTENDIKISRSILYKGRIAIKGHAYIIVSCKGVGELCQQFKSGGMDEVTELALKGNCVKAFRKHFKI